MGGMIGARDRCNEPPGPCPNRQKRIEEGWYVRCHSNPMHVTDPKDQERGFIHAFMAGTYEQLVACRDRWGSLNRSCRVADRDGMRCMAAGGSSATVPGGTYVREPRRRSAGTVLSATAHPPLASSHASTFCRRADRRSAAPSYGGCGRLSQRAAARSSLPVVWSEARWARFA